MSKIQNFPQFVAVYMSSNRAFFSTCKSDSNKNSVGLRFFPLLPKHVAYNGYKGVRKTTLSVPLHHGVQGGFSPHPVTTHSLSTAPQGHSRRKKRIFAVYILL